MNYAIYKFKFGYLKIIYEENTLIGLSKLDKLEDGYKKTEFTNKVYKQICEYINGKRRRFTFSYELRGTDFQKKVWNELLKIPYGQTSSYKDIAIAIGNPNASRAVGYANSKNPILIVVPCHRVIGSNKKLVGYAGGLYMKEKLLYIEKK